MSYTIMEVPVKSVRDFIQTNHYSKNINGVKVSKCYGLYEGESLVGAILYGPLSTTAWKKYADSEKDVVELRRLVCLDTCERNTESWFISKTLKMLRKTTDFKIVISYADPRHGHVGYVYQASNWNYLGTTAPDTVLVTPEGKEYHSRAMRTKYNGELKPFAKRLVDLHKSGLLQTVVVPGKHVYCYSLTGKHFSGGLKYPKKPLDTSQKPI